MTGVKGQSMSASLLKTSGMLRWLEHDERDTGFMFGGRLYDCV